jgi:hypothetical protein
LEAIHNDFSSDPFTLLAIDFWNGSPALVQSYRNATGVTFPLLLNGTDNGIDDAYNCSYHYFFILDHEGVIIWRGHFNDALLRSLLSSAIANVSVTPAVDIPGVSASLGAAYPNPFNPMTRIPYQTALEGGSQMVRLEILDVRGRVVRTIVNTTLPAGYQGEAVWDGLDSTGQRVPSGAYMSRLQVGKFSQSRLLTLVK